MLLGQSLQKAAIAREGVPTSSLQPTPWGEIILRPRAHTTSQHSLGELSSFPPSDNVLNDVHFTGFFLLPHFSTPQPPSLTKGSQVNLARDPCPRLLLGNPDSEAAPEAQTQTLGSAPGDCREGWFLNASLCSQLTTDQLGSE